LKSRGFFLSRKKLNPGLVFGVFQERKKGQFKARLLDSIQSQRTNDHQAGSVIFRGSTGYESPRKEVPTSHVHQSTHNRHIGDYANDALRLLLNHVGLPCNNAGLAIEIDANIVQANTALNAVGDLDPGDLDSTLADVENMLRENGIGRCRSLCL
jgi:hypothetical protein